MLVAKYGVRIAHTIAFVFLPLCAAESRRLVRGFRRGLFEHVAAQRIVRVPQPPDQSSNAGYAEGAANRGGVSLITFFSRIKKVIGVRGRTPRL